MNKENHECCPEFIPEKWDSKTFDWKNKHFLKETIPLLFHIPYPPMIRKKILKMCKIAEESKTVLPHKEDVLVLFTDPHPFKSEIYMSVTEPVQNANSVDISGTFITKVFDGPYNAIPKCIKEMDNYLASVGKKANKYYVHYAYCPKCAKESGHNYMILFTEV